ncbi:MAG TPA: class III extradiol dioxygenase subunit B-like domain-containing protein [Candidatus Baltobacteraceae bacterium]|nr:class III extradiol dioxygenase subunit B-like domain-containing protein [Candidatus Baltobacteraceae bacterium]
MPIVFAAVVPHSPVLIPSIGKEHLKKLKKTVAAMKRIEQDLYASHPDTILVISPHGPVEAEHFTLDLDEKYACDLKDFGVFDVDVDCRADMRLTSALREHLEDRGVPFMLRSEAGLDYGVVVPLTYLTGHLKKFSVLPVYPALLSAKSHFEFGQAIQEVLMHTDRRVAVLASADLSHRLTRTAPAGYSPYGKKFDEKILTLLKEKRHSALLTFEPELAAKAAQCGLPPLTILAGILDGIDVVPEVLSYESPFGIGLITAQYTFA